MEYIHANLSASISEFKKNPTDLLKQAGGEPIAILTHNKPTAYLIHVELYEYMLNKIENAQLLEIAQERLKEKEQAIQVNVDDL